MNSSTKILCFRSLIVLAMILLTTLNGICQTVQDCSYGEKLNKINHFLDSSVAAEWITHYTAYTDSVKKGLITFNFEMLPDSIESFNTRFIQKILQLPDCVGERVFMGINNKQKMVVIIGGIDSCGRTLYITNEPIENKESGAGGSKMHIVNSKLDAGGKGLVELGQNP